MEEGRKLRQKQADELLKLETIKQIKLNGLAHTGIDSKYHSDLAKQKIVL